MLKERMSGQEAGPMRLLVARRDVNATATTCFRPLENQHLGGSQHKIEAEALNRIDGQYVILISRKKDRDLKCSTGKVKGGDEGAASDERKATASRQVYTTQPSSQDATPMTGSTGVSMNLKTSMAASMSGYASRGLMTVQLLILGLLL